MERYEFHAGDIILLDGLYRCNDTECQVQAWGVAGRRFPHKSCGHTNTWTLVRRRVDLWL